MAIPTLNGISVAYVGVTFPKPRISVSTFAPDYFFFLLLLLCLTSVNEHESLPQAHAQQGVLHHQAGEASRQVPFPSRHVVDDSAVPGGEQRVRATVPLSARAP